MSATPPWLDDSLAANGKPVRENFGAWFSKSLAVDDESLPRQLFHGTTANFDAFSKEFIGSACGADDQGFFFTNCPATAATFALGEEDQGYSEDDRLEDALLVSVYLSLQRPLLFDHVFDAFKLKSEDIFEDENYEHVGDFFDLNQARILKLAKKRRCDGIYLEADGFVQAVAFEPHQIKSAIGNSGLYLGDSASLTDFDAALALRQALQARRSILSAASTRKLVAAP